jgi:hypothetical protein
MIFGKDVAPVVVAPLLVMLAVSVAGTFTLAARGDVEEATRSIYVHTGVPGDKVPTPALLIQEKFQLPIYPVGPEIGIV